MSLQVSAALRAAAPLVTGRVRRVVGLNLEVEGLDAAIGDAVLIDVGGTALPAEVVALRDGGLVCMPFGTLQGVRTGAPVQTTGGPLTVGLGDALLGRVLDGLGRPVDDGPDLSHLPQAGVSGTPPHPLRRARVDTPLVLGVRAEHVMPGQGSPATVEVVEHLGERTLIHARLRDGSILVYAEPGDSALRAGDAVAVQADGTTVHLFDSAGRAYHAG